MGALSFLTRKIGASMAEKMVFSGKIYTAAELHEMGVVDVLVEDGMGEQAVYDLVERNDRSFASRRAGSQVELALTDTGVGIPEEVQARLFEPFFTHGKPRGLGLGMSIARKIVEEHGGEVGLESRPGEGTRVTIRMPLEPPALAASPRRRAGER